MRVTVGIDLAASPDNTAIVRLGWESGRATVETVHVKAVDDLVLHWMHDQSAVIGIDCPFGWPASFVQFVSRHADGDLRPRPMADGWRRDLALRATDRFVHARYGLMPLSVAADRIAHVALRFAALRARLEPNLQSPLDGSGALVEVYPAVALKLWGLPHRGYKGQTHRQTRAAAVDQLKKSARWLRLGSHEHAFKDSDHALDALICALVARARQVGRTELPNDVTLARSEGWIHVPNCDLSELAVDAAPSPWVR